MNINDATRKKYNAIDVHPTTDPDDPRSHLPLTDMKATCVG